ncbi:MAG: SOS response-associated peptidase [Solirubrobacteraceae bacterium]
MCGRYTNTARPGELELRFGVGIPFSEGTVRFNIAPTESIVAVVRPAPDAPLAARALRWGLVPHWAADTKNSFKMINARAETAASRPAYRGLLASSNGRALLLADGFYEWLRSEDPKLPRQPFRFTVDGGRPFAFAGLWGRAHVGGERIESATMLTTVANTLVAPVHDRMPVILAGREEEQAWLDPALDGAAALNLCRPLAPERMQVAAANPAMNKAGIPEGPELLAC